MTLQNEDVHYIDQEEMVKKPMIHFSRTIYMYFFLPSKMTFWLKSETESRNEDLTSFLREQEGNTEDCGKGCECLDFLCSELNI